MEDQLKEYIVTLHRHEDLEEFYEDMETPGGNLYIPDRVVNVSVRRPISRNTNYLLTEEEANLVKNDERVWDVILKDSIKFMSRAIINNSPYTVSGDFWKDSDSIVYSGPESSEVNRPSFTADPNYHQWGLLHCAGNSLQRRKGAAWGGNENSEVVNDSVTVFNDGKHVDIVIVDSPIPYDCEEWYSPTTNTSRFVQYQWFNELNTYVSGIDDDGKTLPTGSITYSTNASADPSKQFHGTLAASVAAGKYNGWAREANIYNLAVTGVWESGQGLLDDLIIFDYLRAFHRHKAINSETGFRNPTITNHSYGAAVFIPIAEWLSLSSIQSITYQGVTYNSSNPGPSGWTETGVRKDFGVWTNDNADNLQYYANYIAAMVADVQDCINDGVVLIGAAGNENLLLAEPGDINWDNEITLTGGSKFYYNRGGAPNNPDSGILQIGALSDEKDFRRATYSVFGSGVDYYAPGDYILGATTNLGEYYKQFLTSPTESSFSFLIDTKYSEGTGNYWIGLPGTSFASPQVCGIIACGATNRQRFTQDDARAYLQKNFVSGDMTFDVSGGGYDDPTCSKGSPNKYVICDNPRDKSGYILEQKGTRKSSGMMFPRRKHI